MKNKIAALSVLLLTGLIGFSAVFWLNEARAKPKVQPAITAGEEITEESLLLEDTLMADEFVREDSPADEPDPLEEFIDLAIQYAVDEPAFPVENSQTKYGELFGDPWAEWCTEFIMWSLKQAEDELNSSFLDTVYPYVDNSLSAIDWYEKQGRFFFAGDYIPRKGDLVFFNHNDPLVLVDHLGLVTQVIETDAQIFIITIEGNIPTDTIKQIRSRVIALDSEIILGYGICEEESFPNR